MLRGEVGARALRNPEGILLAIVAHFHGTARAVYRGSPHLRKCGKVDRYLYLLKK